ncbi:sigma-70 family RNA polymerase sigma factor [Halobacillus massiliensis]|uniref:sigma-70 family RNA polymerase sigma factor n=1 Tax=Halobacillus massiliensis TaxID=1926286 RepID=UPI0009E35662|nr:sigma-70 family RNA polymerase sigma factor [Halobacillus massiliensis]
MINKKDSLEAFKQKNYDFFNEPLIQSFIKEEENLALLKAAVEDRNPFASRKLDQRFEEFYLKVRMTGYLHKIASFYSKTYDQKLRQQRSELTLDTTVQSEEEKQTSLVDQIPAGEEDHEDEIARCIPDLITDPKLKEAYESLSDQKKTVLDLSIMKQLTNKEIASYLACSPQNISKLKVQAIHDLRRVYTYD